jgi:hypothetical protein
MTESGARCRVTSERCVPDAATFQTKQPLRSSVRIADADEDNHSQCGPFRGWSWPRDGGVRVSPR